MNKIKLINKIISINNIINESISVNLDKPLDDELSKYNKKTDFGGTLKVDKKSINKGEDVINLRTQLTSLRLVSKNISAGLLSKIKNDMITIYNKLKSVLDNADKKNSGIPFVDRNLIAELSEMIKLLSTILIYLPWQSAGKLLFKLKNLLPILLDVYKKNTVRKDNLSLMVDQIHRINIILNNISFKDREFASFNL